MDCSAFLNWSEERLGSEKEKAVIFRSLVATVKLQPTLDDSLKTKAVKFLKYVTPENRKSADAFLGNNGRITDEYLTTFIQSIVVLITTPNRVITAATMKMLETMIRKCSDTILLALAKAALIPQLINTLNPLSISFTEAVNIHTCLVTSIMLSVWLASPDGLRLLQMKDGNEQQSVRKTVLTQVLAPSEKYICHLCVNRSSIIDGEQSMRFLELITSLLEISPYYQPTMETVLHMPLFLTIPSCLTFFENESSIWSFLDNMYCIQRRWNTPMGDVRQIWKNVLRMLRMEGFEDVVEAKLQNYRNTCFGGRIVSYSIGWNNQRGMNLPECRW